LKDDLTSGPAPDFLNVSHSYLLDLRKSEALQVRLAVSEWRVRIGVVAEAVETLIKDGKAASHNADGYVHRLELLTRARRSPKVFPATSVTQADEHFVLDRATPLCEFFGRYVRPEHFDFSADGQFLLRHR
jgi:hypothetical protein